MKYNPAMHELGVWDKPLVQKVFQPGQLMKPYIQSYQLLTGQQLVPGGKSWYILPDNCAHLIFHLYKHGNTLKPYMTLVGPRTKHKLISRANRCLTFITTFHPGGLSFFCPVPVSELIDKATVASELFFEFDDELLGNLSGCAVSGNIRALIHQIESILHSRLNLSQNHLFLRAWNSLKKANFTKVADFASQLGITERHLRSLSKSYIGHSPKLILQIGRFTDSLMMSNDHREWTAIACDAGYFDQSHMIAEYQRMVGTSPERLFNS